MTKTQSLLPTVAQAIDRGAAILGAAAIPGARLEARLLLGHAANLPVERILAERERVLDEAAWQRFDGSVARRARREPLAHIVGAREFWSLPFKVTPDTLIPRPETETLVEAALALVPDHGMPLRLLDLGTGTGCLLLALLSELPKAEGIGVDISEAACGVARDNGQRLGLGNRALFLTADWNQAGRDEDAWGRIARNPFDLVLANPPYIPEGEIPTLQPEVARFEPRIALGGGPDGLDGYRALAHLVPDLLSPQGHALVELGQGQGDPVAALMAAVGLSPVARRPDLAGIERCIVFTISPKSPPAPAAGFAAA